MTKKLNLGILGLGEGRSVMSAALNSDYWNLVNICDLDEELCKKRCTEFNFDRYTLDYGDLLNDPKIDVIAVYTPDQLHADHIIMALSANKHVISTKPLMIGLNRANDLLEAQKKTSKKVFIGQSSRYFEPTKQQRKDYENGNHGQLTTLETQYVCDARWFLSKDWSHKAGFSWLYNFMIHAIDLAAWYLPNIETVYGAGFVSEKTTERGLDVPDSMKFILTDEDGVSASVTGVYTEPTFGDPIEQSISCTLRGTEGISRAGYPGLYYDTKFIPKNANNHTPNILKHYDFEDKSPYYFRFDGRSHHAGEYQNYFDEFAELLNAGKTPKPDLKEGIHTIAIVEAMELSMRTKKVVKVSDILKQANVNLNIEEKVL